MNNRIVVYSTDVHRDAAKAKLGVEAAAEALGIECDCRLMSAWWVYVDRKDQKAFLGIAREVAREVADA